MSTRCRQGFERTAVRLALALSILLLLPGVAHAATITVTSTADVIANDGLCTLREAITAANTDAAYNGCPAGAGADTVDIPPGTYTLAIASTNEDNNIDGDLDVRSVMTLLGTDPQTTIIEAGPTPGSGISRVLHVAAGNLTVDSLTIRHGNAFGSGFNQEGAAIYNDLGQTLNVVNCVIRDNQSTGWGGIANRNGALLNVRDTSFLNNPCGYVGGAIKNWYGTVNVANSTFSGNTAAYGAAISSDYGTLNLTNVTIVGNSSSYHGGSLSLVAGVTSLLNVLMTGNTPEECYVEVAGTFTGQAVLCDDSSCAGSVGRATGVDPVAQLNGGYTETHALLPGSNALNGAWSCVYLSTTGNPLFSAGSPVTSDQNGYGRPQGGACDIGACEFPEPPTCGFGGFAFRPAVGQWQMIGLPCDPQGMDLQTVLGDDLPMGTYGTEWIVWRRDALADSYVMVAPTDPLTSLDGYWLKTIVPPLGDLVTVDGAELAGTASLPLVYDPAGRANLLGNVYPRPLPWPEAWLEVDGAFYTVVQAELNGFMSDTMWQWNGAAYQAFEPAVPGQEGYLLPTAGFWVKAFGGGTTLNLLLGPPAIPLEGGAGWSPRQLVPGELTVRLVAEAGGLVDPGNLLGQLNGAAVGFDGSDLEEPPPFAEPYLTVVFPHPEWQQAVSDYTTDFHPVHAGHDSWRFEVRSSLQQLNARLRWSGPGELLARCRLVDEATGAVVAGRRGSYTFRLTGPAHPFRWELAPRRTSSQSPEQ